MAAGRIVLSQYFPARDRSGRLVSGALLYVYANGTTTKASIYSNEALSTPLANPVAANSSGQFPAIWASDAATYTLSITGPDGESIGNPSVFDDYSVSTDADTASVALAEAAATAAEEAYADVLAVVATGDNAAAIAARAAKAANLSDLADAEEATSNLLFLQSGTGAVERSLRAKLRDAVSASDYGVTADGTTDDTLALQAALAANPGKTVMLPAGTIRLGQVGGLEFAGTRIVGDGRWETIIKPIASLNAGEAIFYNPFAATASSAYMAISNIRFRFDGQNVTGVDLSSCNNSVVEQCYFAGSEAGATVTGVGVRFGSPLDSASYSNNARDCAFYSLAKGVEYLVNANSNMVTGGECIFCDIGVDAAPAGYLDTPRIIGMRFEGGGIGIKEKSQGANYIACRFENNSVADIDFIDNGSGDQSLRPMVIGGYTATTLTTLRNLANAVSPVIMSPDMGRYDVEASTTPKWFGGRHVFAGVGTALPISPAPPGGYAIYAHDPIFVRNQIPIEAVNSTGTNTVIIASVDSGDRVTISGFDRASGTYKRLYLGEYFSLNGTGLEYAGVKVLGTQGAAVADATDAASAITQLNLLLARCRAHGLIAT